MNYVIHVTSTVWRIKNQASNSTSCIDNALRLLGLVLGDYIEDFEWCLHFQFGVVFWRVVVREVDFEGHWRLQSCTLWPLHTRDWEPMIIALWALSLVEKAELVQVRLTLCFKDHWSMWVQDGCVKSTWIPTWRWMDHVSWSIRVFSKTTSWR